MQKRITKLTFPTIPTAKKRVAAYARVSSGKDAMLHSLSAQVSYYSNLIQTHNDWEYVGVYADEAISGTKEKRKNFQRLLDDCRDGRIDLIITKSISRFARNTVTLLETVRELKRLGIDVYFEEQNIHTISADGELMITILASYAQEESRSARRQKLGRSYSGASIFSSKVICGECGSFYAQKIWHSNDPYRKVVWRCNRKFNGKYVCETPTLDADEIKEKFIIAYNQLLGNRKELFEACELMCEEVGDCSALNAEIDKLNEEIEEVTERVNRFVKENASTKLSQEGYDQKYNSLVKRFEKADKRLSELTQQRDEQIKREREIRIFISELAEKPLVIEEWDEELWVSVLESATVHKDGRITFLFKNGRSIEVGGG